MPNDYFNYSVPLSRNTSARAEVVNAQFQALQDGFDKLPGEAQLKQGRANYAAAVGGTANAITVTMTYPISSYVEGLTIRFKAAAANTASATVNVDGVGVKAIIQPTGVALTAGNNAIGGIVELVYNGTSFVLTSSYASSDVTTVAGIAAAVSTVAGISSNVTTVAGNTSNINTVAGISGNVTTVAAIAGAVSTVAARDADIVTVAARDADIATLADLQDGTTATAALSTLAGISAQVVTVAARDTDIGTVATNIASVTTVAGSIASVNTVAARDTDIGTVATIIADIQTNASNI
ncbi:MAG: hypothetical protein Q7J57_17895, partial [Gemmobacter sp.]|nr:hypothetical protein [Gemmobacter sp.]